MPAGGECTEMSDFQEGNTHLRYVLRELCVLHARWHLPVVHAPPPAPYPRAHAVSTELGRSVPVPPPAEHEGPEYALREAEDDLLK